MQPGSRLIAVSLQAIQACFCYYIPDDNVGIAPATGEQSTAPVEAQGRHGGLRARREMRCLRGVYTQIAVGEKRLDGKTSLKCKQTNNESV